MDKKERMECLVGKLLAVAAYDRRTGNFVCRAPIGNRSIGNEMGFIDGGIKKIQIDGMKERVHRIVYFLETGKIPSGIRHINGNRLDNRFENLRKISTCEAVQKRERMRSDNTSGICRLFYRKSKAGWFCGVRLNGKYKEIRIKNIKNAEEECKEFLKGFSGAVNHLTKKTDLDFEKKQIEVSAEAHDYDFVKICELYREISEEMSRFRENKSATLWRFNETDLMREYARKMTAGELIAAREVLR